MSNGSDVENLFYGFRYRGFSLKVMKPLIELGLQMTMPDSIIRVKLLQGLEANWSGHFKNDVRLTLDAVLLIDPSNFKYREADILLLGGLFEIDPFGITATV